MKLLSLSNTNIGIKGEYFNENFEKRVPFYIGSFTPDIQELWNSINIALNELMNFGIESPNSPQNSFFQITKITFSEKKEEYVFSGTCKRNLYSYQDAANYTIQSYITAEQILENEGKPKGMYLNLASELGGMVDLLLTSFEPNAYVDIMPIPKITQAYEVDLFSNLPNHASNE